ncbi:MAG TPA: glycosyltransferase family 10 [Phycisphaerae bacterium]|nr:glycosyltransferase family 10 [Phycisphaerae bacterium]
MKKPTTTVWIREINVAGKRFKFTCGDRKSSRMTLRPDHRIEGAPSVCEHSWEIESGKLILRHRNGQRTMELSADGEGRYVGNDLIGPGSTKAELKLDWRARFFKTNNFMRRVRYLLHAEKRPSKTLSLRELIVHNGIGLRFERKKIRWIFSTATEMRFFHKALLPWVFPNFNPISANEPADFTVGVYLDDQTIQNSFAELSGRKFLLSGEMETRHPHIADCHSFVQNPLPNDDPMYMRYSPTFCCWTPPRDRAKTDKCSVVDSGQYTWRARMIYDLAERIHDVDIFGKLSGHPLGGYHWKNGRSHFGNDKYLGLEHYCFYLAIERAVANDYITEKFNDAVMCNALPVYNGAPNVQEYAIPESYILTSEIDKVDWNNWRREYERRLPALMAQKELIRMKLNLFSYFHLLTENLSLLDRRRPMTQ